MTRRHGTAQFVAARLSSPRVAPARTGAALVGAVLVGAVLALAGCGTVGLFGEYDVPESPDVESTPYPRLVDVPDAPAVGEFSESVPDPAVGYVAETDLAAAATRAEARATALRRPVISDAERAALLAAAGRRR